MRPNPSGTERPIVVAACAAEHAASAGPGVGAEILLRDEVFALENRCPHKGGPLSDGIVHGRKVACPLHNWIINLDDGEATGADKGCARSFPVKLENGRIYLDMGVAAAP